MCQPECASLSVLMSSTAADVCLMHMLPGTELPKLTPGFNGVRKPKCSNV